MYYDNLFSLGPLTGTNSSDDNPASRIGDGSINLNYALTSGTNIVSGEVEVTLTSGQAPQALVLALGVVVSGHRFILESEDVGGGNNATVLDFTVSGNQSRFIQDITPATTARRVWRLTVSGTVSGLAQMEASELQLATKVTMPRTPQVSVRRSRVRQFTRLDVPGGQPFTKRDGPNLRRTQMTVIATSGSELDTLTTFVEAIEGGESFTLVDDLGDQYWAELPQGEVPFPDEAGVYALEWTFREVNRD
jgi:hypothetical protein